MGTMSFVRWLKVTHPRHFRSILGGLCAALLGVGIWGFLEAIDRPSFHPGDLITPQEPIVVRVIATERNSLTASCIVEIYEHLSVVSTGSGTMKALVESNKMSGPTFCPVGVEVQFEIAWLHRYTLTQQWEYLSHLGPPLRGPLRGESESRRQGG
jgi:hypothetical protein